MTTLGAAAAGATLAILMSGVVAGLLAWAGPVDAPHARGFHRSPTPTSGGLAIMAAAAMGAWLFAALAPSGAGALRQIAACVGFAGAFAVVGAMDDLFDFGARAKLLVQAVLALVFAVAVARIQLLPLGFGLSAPLGPLVGALGTTLWIVVATNGVNFLDGANGVAPGAMVVALLAFAVAAFWAGAPGLGGVALAGSAAGAGFLPWNLGGRLFQGDAGALFSSFLFAALCVVGAGSHDAGPVFLYFGPLALLPVETDVLLTLLVRARRGESLLEAHRDHLYQLWLSRSGKPHLALAWRVWAIMGVAGAAALAVQHVAPLLQPPLFALAVLVCATGWALTRRRLERAPPHG